MLMKSIIVPESSNTTNKLQLLAGFKVKHTTTIIATEKELEHLVEYKCSQLSFSFR